MESEDNTLKINQINRQISIYVNYKGGFWLNVKAKILTFLLKPFIVIRVYRDK